MAAFCRMSRVGTLMTRNEFWNESGIFCLNYLMSFFDNSTRNITEDFEECHKAAKKCCRSMIMKKVYPLKMTPQRRLGILCSGVYLN